MSWRNQCFDFKNADIVMAVWDDGTVEIGVEVPGYLGRDSHTLLITLDELKEAVQSFEKFLKEVSTK